MTPAQPVPARDRRRPSTRERRARAARLYAASYLLHDDGEMASDFKEELDDVALGILARARWPHNRIPTYDDIQGTLQGTPPAAPARTKEP